MHFQIFPYTKNNSNNYSGTERSIFMQTLKREVQKKSAENHSGGVQQHHFRAY